MWFERSADQDVLVRPDAVCRAYAVTSAVIERLDKSAETILATRNPDNHLVLHDEGSHCDGLSFFQTSFPISASTATTWVLSVVKKTLLLA